MEKYKNYFKMLLIISPFILASCSKDSGITDTITFNEDITETDEDDSDILDVPANFKYDKEKYKITWDEVKDAVGYEITYNNEIYNTTDTEFDVLDIFSTDITYNVTIRALAANQEKTSDYHDDIKVKIEPTANLSYTLTDDGTGYSVGRGSIDYYKLPEIIVIPDTYSGLPVTKITDHGFSVESIFSIKPNTTVKRIRLSHNLIQTGYGAFFSLANLEAVKLPDTLKILSMATFSSCSSLKEINLPSGLEKIESGVLTKTAVEEIYIPNIEFSTFLNGCSNLKKVTIEEGVKELPDSLFENDIKLEEVNLPSTLEKIGISSFSGCESLKSITIPDNVSCIELFAFSGCENLEYIDLPTNLSYVARSFDDTKWMKKQTGLIQFNGILMGYNDMPENYDFIIPENIHFISRNALSEQNNLVSVKIPSSVTYIADYVFDSCKNLKKVIFEASVDEIPMATFEFCSSLEEVTLSDNIKTIGNKAFYKCSKLVSINRPKNLQNIGFSSFASCTSLSYFDLTNLTTINSNAFNNVGFTSLKIENDMLGDTFSSSVLEYVIIGKNVTNMPLLNKCNALKSVFYEGTKEEYQSILRKNYDTSSSSNSVLNATIYYYSETKPEIEGNYWHYVDDKPVIWE